MSDRDCWGIFRERAHSPGREGDDAEILRLTGKHLEAMGYQVSLKTPEEAVDATEAWPRRVFLMCERVGVLRRLRGREAAGATHVNSAQAVLNTYRDRMIDTLAEADVPFIESRIVSTSTESAAPFLPVWLKRADVHNTQDGDVVLADSADAFARARRALAARGIDRAVLQPHVTGDLVKFYGIGGGARDGGPAWFRWFYHRDQRLAGHPLDAGALARLVRRAASALGLEIYGGDAIATAGGGLVLLDVNAWPSFALYRDEAAPRIAEYLALRFTPGRRDR